jgi:hypothetical protein
MTICEHPSPRVAARDASPTLQPTVLRRRAPIADGGGPPRARGLRDGHGGGGGGSPLAAFWAALRGALEGSAGH